MHTLRKYLSWIFAFTSLVCVEVTLSSMLHTTRRHHTRALLGNLLVAIVFLPLAAVFARAWWTVWRGKPSARGWGIAASLVNILVCLPWFILSPTSAWRALNVVLAIGVIGLVAFARRYEQPASTAGAQETLPIPGDGTNGLINKTVGILTFAVAFSAYLAWERWLRTRGVPVNQGFWHRAVMATLLGLIIATLHELSHTVTGLTLGMKLYAFIVGPFQCHIRDGKWEFKFKPKEILSGGGATAVVPTTADFSRRSYLCVLAAGPSANLLTGVFALCIAFAAGADSRVQTGGLLALFGAWSLVLGAVNLLPFRARDNYSDGAKIYQLLSNGPWRDYHRAALVVRSSLVTPLRPRNYDIEAILRAEPSITRETPGLFLRLYAYNCFLDQGKIPEAGASLREAESIYHQSASDIPAELHTEFVFGSAYVLRDAVAAREWWTRMVAKKPTRFNSDYWRAYSALHWIEGNLKEANEAWAKSNALAQQLPKAGAYEFERYCCSLLRKALDDVVAAG